MKRQLQPFLLFGFCAYYPGGGESDFIGDYETLEKAQDAALGYMEIYQVLDTSTGQWWTCQYDSDWKLSGSD